MKFKDKDAEIKFLRKVIEAKDRFLISYRIGASAATKPPEWAFDYCDRYNNYLKQQ